MERKFMTRAVQNNPHAGIRQGFIAKPENEGRKEIQDKHSENFVYSVTDRRKPFIGKV